MPAFMIAAAHKSSGKTVISTGLAAAFKARGLVVKSFKKGPDYIDPMWLSAASGQSCYNLDFNTMNEEQLLDLFAQKSADCDVALVEANKGLFDGVELDGSDSNAQLAKILNLPVILVIDTNGMTRGIAPLLLGYQAFDNDINIAGIILNKIGGARHEEKLRAAVKKYTSFEVLGAIGRNKQLDIGERHLGLTTPAETGELDKMIKNFGHFVGEAIDLDRLIKIAKIAPVPKVIGKAKKIQESNGLRIGIIRDEAFGFYYADDLEAFEQTGVELVFIDSLHDQHLPNIDGLFIGGGFPEMQMERLSANHNLLKEIREAIEAGLPTYAECGGLMYLCKSIEWHGQCHEMLGVIKGRAVMNERPQGRGYAKFEILPTHPWGVQKAEVAAHEFHYASLENLDSDVVFARKITRGHGIDGKNDAISMHNLLAGFCHLRNSPSNPWVARFVDFVKLKKYI